MAEDKTRIIERAQKLLRLAGPKSGTTDHERTNAALEAARLVEEHDLVLTVPAPKKKRQRPSSNATTPGQAATQAPRTSRSTYTPPQRDYTQHPNSRPYNARPSVPRPFTPEPELPRVRASEGDWRETYMGSTIMCSACHLPIHGGEQAWVDTRTGRHRHHNITCDADIGFDIDDEDDFEID